MIYAMAAVMAVGIFAAGYFLGRGSAFKESTKIVNILRAKLKEVEDALKFYRVLPKKG